MSAVVLDCVWRTIVRRWIMIVTGLAALPLSVTQHQSLRSLTLTYGPQPRSTSGVVAGFVSVVELAALAAVVLRA